MGKITVLQSGAAPRDVQLDKPRLSIGRRSHNDVRIDDPAVSGEHAAIVRIGADVVLEDLDSTNGTRVNGQPVKKHFLQDGDVVELATHRLVYHAVAAVSALAPDDVPILEVSTGPNAGLRTPIVKTITTVGAAGQMLMIVRRGADWYLRSAHGGAEPPSDRCAPEINDRRLYHGDVIVVGGDELRFLHPWPAKRN
ncbi:MAG TPA: FHA domain-containing protein [Noviherbaspirillum sp.]|jgi:pSer/pThr/pTyr-binding forkhead associated (FHA) protein|uniref:FHA domain-containing protein n=1 Tax=Noviherbaspirillum sp. TaxID=1926288 RepID=UPI002F91DB4F